MEVGQGPNWGCSAKEKKIIKPITVVARSKAWNVFAHSDTGLWALIPLEASMSVCAFSVCLCCPV
jgi:hypothetical protein